MEQWAPSSVLAVLSVIAMAILAAVILTRGLIYAGKAPAPSMLVVSVSLLSLTALIGGLIFDSDSSLALAGAGVGAIAGALSSVFTGSRPDCNCSDSEPEGGVDGAADHAEGAEHDKG